MRTFIAVVTAFLAAALAPTLAFVFAGMALNGKALCSGEDVISLLALIGFCMIFAIAHVVILGLPVSLWLVHTNKFVLRSMLLAGFLIGSLPIALLANTLLRSDWADYIQLVFNAAHDIDGLSPCASARPTCNGNISGFELFESFRYLQKMLNIFICLRRKKLKRI